MPTGICSSSHCASVSVNPGSDRYRSGTRAVAAAAGAGVVEQEPARPAGAQQPPLRDLRPGAGARGGTGVAHSSHRSWHGSAAASGSSTGSGAAPRVTAADPDLQQRSAPRVAPSNADPGRRPGASSPSPRRPRPRRATVSTPQPPPGDAARGPCRRRRCPAARRPTPCAPSLRARRVQRVLAAACATGTGCRSCSASRPPTSGSAATRCTIASPPAASSDRHDLLEPGAVEPHQHAAPAPRPRPRPRSAAARRCRRAAPRSRRPAPAGPGRSIARPQMTFERRRASASCAAACRRRGTCARRRAGTGRSCAPRA